MTAQPNREFAQGGNSGKRFSGADRLQTVQLIGKEQLKIGSDLINLENRANPANLTFTFGNSLFDSRRELHRLLTSIPVYSQEALFEAEAVVQRLTSDETLELSDWAKKLGSEFSKFED